MPQVENPSAFIQKALNHSQRRLGAVKCEMSFLGFIRPHFIQLLAESTSFYLSFFLSISPVFYCRQYVRTKSLQTKKMEPCTA